MFFFVHEQYLDNYKIHMQLLTCARKNTQTRTHTRTNTNARTHMNVRTHARKINTQKDNEQGSIYVATINFLYIHRIKCWSLKLWLRFMTMGPVRYKTLKLILPWISTISVKIHQISVIEQLILRASLRGSLKFDENLFVREDSR